MPGSPGYGERKAGLAAAGSALVRSGRVDLMGDSAAFKATWESTDHVAARPGASEGPVGVDADRTRPGRAHRQVQRLRPSGAPASVALARPSAVPARLVDEALRGPGQPLAAPVREEMQACFGADLSDVRVHSGSAARASAAEISARAYTSGSHIVIGDGGDGKHTLAHELTHVIQQRQGPVACTDNGNGLSLSDPSDPFERAAEASAHRALAEPATETGEAPAPAQRAVPGNLNGRGVNGGRGTIVQRSGRGGGVKRTTGDAEEERKKKREKNEEKEEEETATGQVPTEVIKEIASAKGRKATYAGGGTAKEIRKVPKVEPEKEVEGKEAELACWEWAVRAEQTYGGPERGAFWNQLKGVEVSAEDLKNVQNAVQGRLQDKLTALQKDLNTAGMDKGLKGFQSTSYNHDEIKPLMQRSVEIFVQAHGLEIAADNPAGWIMCHYKKINGFADPEHWWIELPVPGRKNKNVLIQTVPTISHFEAGGTELRWHDENSVPGRRSESKGYETIAVPIKAFKVGHIEVLKRILEPAAE
jgi:Domain of unknown function (DUF4157)